MMRSHTKHKHNHNNDRELPQHHSPFIYNNALHGGTQGSNQMFRSSAAGRASGGVYVGAEQGTTARSLETGLSLNTTYPQGGEAQQQQQQQHKHIFTVDARDQWASLA